MNPTPRLCVIIPAYNEAKTIANVIAEVHQQAPFAEMVVVNDASWDKTGEIVKEAGVPLLSLPVNLGIGGAMQAGFKYAVRQDFDYAIQVDGDGQHDSSFIPVLLSVLRNDEADMVIGSRFMGNIGYTSTSTRLVGIRLFAYLIGLATNKRISDPTSGFRAYNKKALHFVAKYYPQDFPEPESIVLMLRNSFRVKEVPVSMRERLGGISSVRPFKAAYFVATNAIAILIGAIKPKKR